MSDVTDRFHRNPLAGMTAVRSAAACSVLRAVAAALFVQVVLTFSAYHISEAADKPGSIQKEVVVPSGPTILLQDGEAIDGHISRIDQTNVTIQTGDGAQMIVPRSTVDLVRFETVAGDIVEGSLIGWQPGIYELTTAEAVFTVYSTMASPLPATDDAGVTAGQSQPLDVARDVDEETTSGATAEFEGTNGSAADETTGSAVEQVVATTAATDLEINVTVTNARESGPPLAFDIELSRPSESSVVLIYATIDGTAVNGEDYKPMRGVLVIKAGETSARIEASVIDDDIAESTESLQLFLTVDPKVAVFNNRGIVATIEDDDQG